jgi:biotin carboxyl carrier protein
MPGKVVKILVEVGQTVQKGQTLVVLEAMKMENEIKCGLNGTIKAIHVKEGQALDQGVLMMEVEGE